MNTFLNKIEKKRQRVGEYNGKRRESANNMVGMGLQREEAREHEKI